MWSTWSEYASNDVLAQADRVADMIGEPFHSAEAARNYIRHTVEEVCDPVYSSRVIDMFDCVEFGE